MGARIMHARRFVASSRTARRFSAVAGEAVLDGLNRHFLGQQGLHRAHGGYRALERGDAGNAVRDGRGANAALVGPRPLAARRVDYNCRLPSTM